MVASFGRRARRLLREVHRGYSQSIVYEYVVILLRVPAIGPGLGDGELDGAFAGREIHAAFIRMALGVWIVQKLFHL